MIQEAAAEELWDKNLKSSLGAITLQKRDKLAHLGCVSNPHMAPLT